MGKDEGNEYWSYSAGRPPSKVRVYERERSPNIYVATWEDGELIRRSLKHSDREKAKDTADELAIQLRKEADAAPKPKTPTVARVLKLYRKHRSPDKSAGVQKADKRQAAMWRTYLGPSFDLRKLSRREWDSFVRQRRSGAIGPRGKPRVKDNRTEVGDRTIERDLRFLRAVCNWATKTRTDAGNWLLEGDPTRGLPIPKEKNPKRPVATHDRVDAIRKVYRDVTMRVERNGGREQVESYLPEIFEIVVGTGRRISAVCSLRLEDLNLDETAEAPFGAIVWPEDTDKTSKRYRCPITKPVREALEDARRKRARIFGQVGPGPLFPSPGSKDRALRYEEASAWLRAAEKDAKLEPHDGSLWHAYRRLWATVRKDLPAMDVAKAGGWETLETLKTAYQRPDDATMLRVVQHDAELREAR